MKAAMLKKLAKKILKVWSEITFNNHGIIDELFGFLTSFHNLSLSSKINLLTTGLRKGNSLKFNRNSSFVRKRAQKLKFRSVGWVFAY